MSDSRETSNQVMRFLEKHQKKGLNDESKFFHCTCCTFENVIIDESISSQSIMNTLSNMSLV